MSLSTTETRECALKKASDSVSSYPMFFLYAMAAAMLSFFLTPIVRAIMRKYGIVDRPKTLDRKVHKKTIALGGGWAIWASFFLLLAAAIWLAQDLGNDVQVRNIIGLFLGATVLVIGGTLDDKYSLKPRYQIIFPILASMIAVSFGIGIESVSNPSGGLLQLNQWSVSIEGLGRFVVLADMLVFFWLMGMMFTTKFFDGLDGLVTGVSVIGAIMVFFVSLQSAWYQPEIALIAAIFAGSCFGFLIWNNHPAKMFLGEGGSLLTGYVLGILALISGSKIATTLLVMGFPMLDLIRVILVRLKKGKSPFVGDQEHLHYRLLNAGLTHKQVVLLLYSIAALFGLSALFLQNEQKLIALGLIFVLMLLLAIFFLQQDKKPYDSR